MLFYSKLVHAVSNTEKKKNTITVKWMQYSRSDIIVTTNTVYTVSQKRLKNFENRLRFDKVAESLKVGTFFETQCSFRR